MRRQWSPIARTTAVSESFNLPLLRIWCRKRDAWLSFRTRNQDRYFINPYGYFVELPDCRLAQVTARVAFPLINCYPSVVLSDLEVQSGFGSAAYFVFALRQGDVIGQPEAIKLTELRHELEGILPSSYQLSPPERYLALRLLESGLLPEDKIDEIIRTLPAGKTLGQVIVSGELCRWEVLLATCLDTRQASNFDPPGSTRRSFLREWELAGEILIAMGKITRSKLEYALQIKREGSKTLGEILTAIGACTQEDIDNCLLIQNSVRDSKGSEVGLIGDLLVRRGIISQDALNEALNRQNISGQPLSQVFIALNFCTAGDIDEYKQLNDWHAFQGQLEDSSLANWLLMRGKLNEQQIQQAIAVQGRGRMVLGQILTAMGLCTQQQIEETMAMQQEARKLHRTGVEKLGSLLLANGRVQQDHVEQALLTQNRGRRALGEILMAVGGCSEPAVRLAIDLQGRWRQQMEDNEDRLGEVLQRRGFLSPDMVQQAVALQQKSGKPMGQVLVDNGFCTPEEIVATLLMRDYKRQCDLHTFIKKNMIMLSETEPNAPSTERSMSGWLQKS